MKKFDYAAPQSIDEAQSILAEHGRDAMLMAGGTDLLVALKQGIHTPKIIVSVNNIAELKGIRFDDQSGLTLGAGVTLSQLGKSNAVREQYPALAQAAESVASYQIRHRATIGGNVALNSRCWYYNQTKFWKKSYPDCIKIGGDTCYAVKGGKRCYAVFSADSVPALIALDARVAVSTVEKRDTMPLADLYTGNGDPTNLLHPGHIITSITVPYFPTRRVYFRKYQNRPSIDFALLTVALSAVRDADRSLNDVRIVIGGVDSAPVRLPEAEESWQSSARAGLVDAERLGAIASKEIRVYNGYNGAAFYKKRIVEEVVREGIHDVMTRLA